MQNQINLTLQCIITQYCKEIKLVPFNAYDYENSISVLQIGTCGEQETTKKPNTFFPHNIKGLYV